MQAAPGGVAFLAPPGISKYIRNMNGSPGSHPGGGDDVEVQRLTDLEQLLLLSVAQAGDGAHAATVREILEERGERPASLGSIYVTMTRLEERGMVTSSMGEPTARRGGKAKRFYRVTSEGLRALHHSRRVLERMWAGLPTPDPELEA